jgi:hypothetical protein
MKVQIDTNFVYDPQRQGYDENLWKTISGTPAISSDKLRISNAAILHYGDCLHGFFNLVANVPATPTNALLTGGTSATAVIGTWQAVTDGEFAITIDGVVADITGLDFSGAAAMAGVATILQTALQAEFGDHVTCVWSTNKFIITARISITVASAVAGGTGTDISGAGATAFMDSDTGNGVITAATNSNKKFGLTSLAKGISAYFHLRGNTLVAVTSDEAGDTTETEITWVAAWTASDIRYEIDWGTMGVAFKVNGVRKAYHETVIPCSVMNLYVDNDLADNFDFAYFEGKEIETYS